MIPHPVAPTAPPLDLLEALRRAGLVHSAAAQLEPLTGGVSSEIFLVTDAERKFVVKRALAKLRVRDDWYADTSRSRSEEAFLRYVATLRPANVPQVIAADPEAGWFAMNYLGDGFTNWKTRLLRGEADPANARQAGEVLGAIHRASWGDPTLAPTFATDRNFHQLRIEPYLETTARRVPELGALLLAEAARLGATHLALVHGDFSPKNMLVAPGQLVLLDAEVAWFGDPAFDTAFVLTHLFLKALVHSRAPDPLLALVPAFWNAYVVALGAKADGELEARTVRLLLCLLIARVHGKSPVEYLSEANQRKSIVDFVHAKLPGPPTRLAPLVAAWRETILSS